jgi:hypothetical protein
MIADEEMRRSKLLRAELARITQLLDAYAEREALGARLADNAPMLQQLQNHMEAVMRAYNELIAACPH